MIVKVDFFMSLKLQEILILKAYYTHNLTIFLSYCYLYFITHLKLAS